MHRLPFLVEIWCHATSPRLSLCINKTPSSDEARGLFDTRLELQVVREFSQFHLSSALIATVPFESYYCSLNISELNGGVRTFI